MNFLMEVVDENEETDNYTLLQGVWDSADACWKFIPRSYIFANKTNNYFTMTESNFFSLNHPYILLYNFRSTWCGCAVTQNTSQRENLFWYTARYKKAVRDMSTCPVTRMSRSIQPSFLATWGALEVSKNMFSAQTCISMIYADIYHRPRQTASSFQWM